MKQRCIMIFPQFENEEIIQKIREQYDPLAKHVGPHITLVFPFESEISKETLEAHIVEAVKGIKPFPLKLQDIVGVNAHGHYLFLMLQQGQEEIIKIHRNLYTSILQEFQSDWLKQSGYLPHMTVGRLDNEESLLRISKELAEVKHSFETLVTTISVEIIDENEDSIIEIEVPLGGE